MRETKKIIDWSSFHLILDVITRYEDIGAVAVIQIYVKIENSFIHIHSYISKNEFSSFAPSKLYLSEDELNAYKKSGLYFRIYFSNYGKCDMNYAKELVEIDSIKNNFDTYEWITNYVDELYINPKTC